MNATLMFEDIRRCERHMAVIATGLLFRKLLGTNRQSQYKQMEMNR